MSTNTPFKRIPVSIWVLGLVSMFVFYVAVIPGMIAVVLLLFGVREPERHVGGKRTNPILRDNLKRLKGAYWWARSSVFLTWSAASPC